MPLGRGRRPPRAGARRSFGRGTAVLGDGAKNWTGGASTADHREKYGFMAEQRSSYSYEDLLACGRGELFGQGNAQLPAPPMLMVDRITEIFETGGANDKGYIRAEFDIRPDHWFFPCHFIGDPVMPGCLGLDALWQLTGFFLGWLGEKGKGRAISTGEVKFTGMITPKVKLVEYGVDFKRVMRGRLVLGIADGWVKADGETVFRATDLKVGLFQAA